MVKVHLWSGLRSSVDGHDEVEVDASTVGEVLRGLIFKYPELEVYIDAGVSVAVDGKIISSDLTKSVTEKSEIYLMQKLRGG